MFDLTKMQLLPHEDKWYSTIRIPVQYDPDAKCPRFMQFLREVMLDDGECVRVIQEIMGYCLTSEMKLQKAPEDASFSLTTSFFGKKYLAPCM